uniref:Small ribosomal subunit protein uS10m n=1 Tax=Eubosmina coregoni TaxID=186181 RepID=A0A4Y7LN97_9CRUS|nr:EOG090X0GP9 [Eubosmina coregoni]SVE70141.1 EOG090X0GP9 [Eubosmina coregoni]
MDAAYFGLKLYPIIEKRKSSHFLNHQTISVPFATNVSNSVICKEDDALFKSVEYECRSGEPAVLASYLKFVKSAADELGLQIKNISTPSKPRHDRMTLLKSVHIYKKHRVQYEVRTHTMCITFEKVTGSTADTYLQYVQHNLPEGVAVKVTKNSVLTLPKDIKQHKKFEEKI